MFNHWFSNFRKMERPLVYKGIEFHTVENFFQAVKSTDPIVWRQVAVMIPQKAKSYCSARECNFKIRADWNDIRVKIMDHALKHKFAFGTKAAARLVTTKDPIIEYNSWHDNFWGDCVCARCINKEGENQLGKLLGEIRNELRKKLDIL